MSDGGDAIAGRGLRGYRVQNPDKVEKRERDILVTAAAIFAEKGYAATSMDDIAQAMGATKGVLYYYFRSKEEIFTQIRVTAISDAIERVDAIVASGHAPVDTLRAAIRDLVSHTFDRLDQYANILETPHGISEESHQTVRSLQRTYEGKIRQILEDGMRDGSIAQRNSKLMAFTMLRAVLSVARWYRPGGSITPEEIIRDVTEQALTGVISPAGRT